MEFEITPPILTPWLDEKEREKNVLLIDLQIDKNKKDEIRFDIDIAFNPISVRRGSVTVKDFYIGCMGAEIALSLNPDKGVLLEFTEGCSLNVNYTNQNSYQRSATVSLVPEIKSENGKNKTDIKLGSLQYIASKQATFSASFSSDERLLAPIKLGNAIKWTITLPRGEKAIRDFLIGNLYLFAVYGSLEQAVSGNIYAKPSDITFFDDTKRALGTKKSIIMRYILYKRNIDISNADGLKIQFKEMEYEKP
ncbi:MAG: hypothetical protein AAGA64_11135 [Bacteroidota bacterium]